MIRLDTHTRKLQAVLGGSVTTNQPTSIVCYTDKENENQKKFFVEAFTATLSNITPVDICPAPDKVMVREIDSIHIRNNDTVAATVTVKIDDNGTGYEIVEVSLAAGETLVYTHSEGWKTISVYGQQTSVFNYIDFALGPYPDAERRMKWNDTDGTVDIGLKGGNVTLQVGQEQVARVKEASNLGIEKGKVYYFAGSDGTNKTVAKAIATNMTQAELSLGVAAESSTGGNKAFICTFGLVKDLNTNHLTEGGLVYLSPSTAGEFVATMPTSPDYIVRIGYCIRKSATVGAIFVDIDAGTHLEYLHDVKLSSLANNQFLKYNSVQGRWNNDTLTAGSGISITHSTATTTIAATGVFTDLTVNGNTILGDSSGDTLTINGTSVSVPNGLNFDSNTLFIDSANNRVGIGTNTPSSTLDVNGAINSTSLTSSGLIESTSGGFKFPDGTTQTTAAANAVGSVLYLYNNFGGF